MTIREKIATHAKRLEIVDNLMPPEASQILVELSSLLSSVNAEITKYHYAYNQKKLEIFKESKTAAEAKIKAEATQEWQQWQERVQTGESVTMMVQSLKYLLRRMEEEVKHS